MRVIKPKGILVPIGGGDPLTAILNRVAKETRRRKSKICYITVAVSSRKEAEQKHRKFEMERGKNYVSTIYYNSRLEADTLVNIEKIKNCDAVLVGGGDQLRLSSLLGGTALLEEIKRRYYDESNFVYAGSSAGAVSMSSTMILSGSSKNALVKGELQLTNGLGLINEVFIDTHLTDRGRFGRLIQAVAYNPGILGLGLSEDTAAVIHGCEKVEIIGSGLAIIIDGTAIEYSNLTEIKDGEPISIGALKTYVLGAGKFFSISERKIVLK